MSSLEADARYINHSIRTHWSVENQLHWTLAVAFGDDASLKQKDNAAQNFSLLNRIGLNIIKNAKVSSMGVIGHRKKAGWDNDYLLYALKSFDVVKKIRCVCCGESHRRNRCILSVTKKNMNIKIVNDN